MTKKFTFANNPLLGGPALVDREKGTGPYREISLSAIERDENQPRVTFDDEKLQELSSSIQKYGVLSPILVKQGKLPGRFIIVAGERRVRASRMAGLVTIPAIIDSEDDSDAGRTLSIQLVENLQRSELTPLERANAIATLRDSYGYSIRELAENIGISKSSVQRSLDLLTLPDDLLDALRNGASESKILLLSKIQDPAERAQYLQNLDSLSRDNLNTSINEKIEVVSTKKIEKRDRSYMASPEDMRISDEIQRALGVKVKLSRSSNEAEDGKLVIDFYSEDDLKELFRRLVS